MFSLLSFFIKIILLNFFDLFNHFKNNIYLKEYAPTVVKQAVTGTGKASKDQIAAMLKILLPGCNYSNDDESDALAIAICHTHYTQFNLKNITEL